MMGARNADVVIIGGGITGLWSRALLSRAGLSVVLIESGRLGDGQTLRSQGILHRGVKYAFSEQAREASAQLAAAAGVWSECLGGGGAVNLKGVRILSDCTHLWTVGGMLAGLTAWSASKALRSGVRELGRREYPSCFSGAGDSVRVWRVQEPVLDSLSLVERVRDAGAGPMVHASVERIRETPDSPGVEIELVPSYRGGSERASASIRASCVVLSAGQGNSELLACAGVDPEAICQRRPLRMGMIAGAPFELFGHCPQPASDKPRLTITSGRGAQGGVWYVGGNVAERGAGQDPIDFHASVRSELAACLPWADFSGARFSWLSIDRAEGRTALGARPDGPVVRRLGHVLAAWPTKMALAPVAADMILSYARELVESPVAANLDISAQAPQVGHLPWDPPVHHWTGL